MEIRPKAENFEGFRGRVRRATPGVGVGSGVVIEREEEGWHLFVISTPIDGHPGRHWDVWCDNWEDAEKWFADWAVDWREISIQ